MYYVHTSIDAEFTHEFFVPQVHQALGLEALKNRTFQIFKASATKGEGLDESMEWLSNALQNRK